MGTQGRDHSGFANQTDRRWCRALENEQGYRCGATGNTDQTEMEIGRSTRRTETQVSRSKQICHRSGYPHPGLLSAQHERQTTAARGKTDAHFSTLPQLGKSLLRASGRRCGQYLATLPRSGATPFGRLRVFGGFRHHPDRRRRDTGPRADAVDGGILSGGSWEDVPGRGFEPVLCGLRSR
ncbi:hypothetical protein DESC_930043 [Desulfosarcina cetonica]|nr:hypothetical protein DESC_930043 [Desulfosarcina cetonica]